MESCGLAKKIKRKLFVACRYILSGSYNNFFKPFHRGFHQDAMYECSREQSKPRQLLRPKRVVNSNLNNTINAASATASTATNSNGGSASPSLNAKRAATASSTFNKATRDEINVDSLDFTKKILHTTWHPKDNVVAIAATNNLYMFYAKDANATSSAGAGVGAGGQAASE